MSPLCLVILALFTVVPGLLLIMVIHRNRTQEALRESQEKLVRAQYIARLGDFSWDLDSDQVTWSDGMYHLLKYDRNEPIDYRRVNRDIHHPDDLDRVTRWLQESIASGETTAPPNEYRLVCKDGEALQVRVNLNIERRAGKVVKVFGTCLDITEQKQIQTALLKQGEDLRRSNAELEQFAYVVSHDLRQPLRMVNSYVQLLERRLAEQLDDESREMMGFVTEGATRMDQMLRSLLEYSRVGRMGEPMAPLDSRDAVEEALLFLEPAIREAQATVRLEGDWPIIVASRDEFTRLFQNLIGNAIKYHAPGRLPEITVSVAPDAAGWRFCVADNGIGIDPAQFTRLFQIFQRLHARDQYDGIGIGLAVSRKIVERHGGRIWVESAGEDQGSRFCFVLNADEFARTAGESDE